MEACPVPFLPASFVSRAYPHYLGPPSRCAPFYFGSQAARPVGIFRTSLEDHRFSAVCVSFPQEKKNKKKQQPRCHFFLPLCTVPAHFEVSKESRHVWKRSEMWRSCWPRSKGAKCSREKRGGGEGETSVLLVKFECGTSVVEVLFRRLPAASSGRLVWSPGTSPSPPPHCTFPRPGGRTSTEGGIARKDRSSLSLSLSLLQTFVFHF